MLRFFKDNRGGVAPMLALSIIPLMGAVGAAVDYSRANHAHATFQSALDATALMVAKDALNETAESLQTQASNYFHALYNKTDATNITVTAVYSSDGGSKVTLTATGDVNTTFLKVLGYDELTITAESVASWGNSRVRVALVLDNTGSMAQDGKMTALKTASQNLLTQLKNSALNDGDVYVSIVPFSKDVNVGSSNYDQSWINWSLWDAANGSCSNSSYHSQSSCVSHGKTWIPNSHTTWNGCVTDRDQNFDTTNDAPTAGGTLYPAEQYSSCPVSLMGLSYDWTVLSGKIDAMQPNGNTNQAIGLQMGWQSLTAAPFSIPEEDPKYEYQQVIILLTDGLNTQDRWYTSQSAIDAREQLVCDNIKAAGIKIYAVQVNTGGDPTSTLLKNCASDNSKFFLLTSADQIITTFGQIGLSLSNLRLVM
jgi:Flp pilus assembly protein TadG